MDVNGTRFHLLATARDWRAYAPGADGATPLLPCDTSASPPEGNSPPAGPPGAVVWDADARSVGLRPLLFRFPSPRGAPPLDPSRRRGAARSEHGHWYTVSDDATGLDVLAMGEREARAYWRPGLGQAEPEPAEPGDFHLKRAPEAEAPAALRELAITRHQHLVTGTLYPGGLLVFDLIGGGAPTVLPWPEETGFRPLDLGARPGGGLWVLDRPGGGPPRLWLLDRHFRVEPFGELEEAVRASDGGSFSAGGAAEAPAPPYPPTIRASSALVLRLSAVAVEPLPDDTVLVLEVEPGGPSRVRRLTAGGRQRGPAVDVGACVERWVERDTDGPFAFAAYDLAFVPDEGRRPPVVTGTLTVVGAGGDQAFALGLFADDDELRLALRPAFLPLRRFGGKGLVAAGGAVHYDLGARWLRLVAQPRPRYEPSGTLLVGGPPLDGGAPGCVWHRLFLDACIPAGTEVAVESRAADDPDLLPSGRRRSRSSPRRGRPTATPARPFSSCRPTSNRRRAKRSRISSANDWAASCRAPRSPARSPTASPRRAATAPRATQRPAATWTTWATVGPRPTRSSRRPGTTPRSSRTCAAAGG